jgi:malate permease and related proteins
MQILPLTIKLLPLYCYIFFGFIAGKRLHANQEMIAKLMFYIITPIIVFNGTLNTTITASSLSLPLLTYCIACSMCLIFYRFSRKIWTDTSKNIMAFSAGSGATGYFGIPLAMMIFSPEKEGIYIMALLGITLYDYSLGYYISAKGTYTAKECLLRLLRLPTLYAFMFGLIMNHFQVIIPDVYEEFLSNIKGVYIVLGMMIVGIGISELTSFKIDIKFVGMTFLAKFFVWPLIVMAIITLDANYLGFYDAMTHQALILLSIVPIAINTVIMASMTNSQPDKASATVLLSTLFALLYIPIMVDLFLVKDLF